ncbi:unnamed protein product [Rhodiola kirilowii]
MCSSCPTRPLLFSLLSSWTVLWDAKTLLPGKIQGYLGGRSFTHMALDVRTDEFYALPFRLNYYFPAL